MKSYFYIIRDVENDMLYVGSKYGKDADASNFMTENGYKTSSNTIKRLISEHGLERFEIVRLKEMSNSFEYETRFLKKVKASKNKKLYNFHNNDFATPPNTTVVKDKDNNIFRVYRDDERFLKGELVGVAKGIRYKHKSNENYKNVNKGNIRNDLRKKVKVWNETFDFSFLIDVSEFDPKKHKTVFQKEERKKEHNEKIGKSNRKARLRCCCLKCGLELGINNLNIHINGKTCSGDNRGKDYIYSRNRRHKV